MLVEVSVKNVHMLRTARAHSLLPLRTRLHFRFCCTCPEPQVGLLDVDICGPSVPRMLGLTGQEVHQSSSGWSPVWVNDGLGVMSIGFMLPQQDNAVIWRGPRKNGLIKQFLTVRVAWTMGEGGAYFLTSKTACNSDFVTDMKAGEWGFPLKLCLKAAC